MKFRSILKPSRSQSAVMLRHEQALEAWHRDEGDDLPWFTAAFQLSGEDADLFLAMLNLIMETLQQRVARRNFAIEFQSHTEHDIVWLRSSRQRCRIFERCACFVRRALAERLSLDAIDSILGEYVASLPCQPFSAAIVVMALSGCEGARSLCYRTLSGREALRALLKRENASVPPTVWSNGYWQDMLIPSEEMVASPLRYGTVLVPRDAIIRGVPEKS